MNITKRQQWNAIPPKGRPDTVPMSRRTEFLVHHSAGPADQPVRTIQRFHMQEKGWNDIGYNFLVRSTTGEIFEGRGWSAVGSHAIGRNREAIGVCLIGTDTITPASKESLRWLYQLAVHFAGHPLQARGHRDHGPTECPGDRVYRWITGGGLEVEPLPLLVLTTPFTVGRAVRTVQRRVGADVDGIYGPETERRVRRWQAGHGLTPDGIVGPLTWLSFGITSPAHLDA